MRNTTNKSRSKSKSVNRQARYTHTNASLKRVFRSPSVYSRTPTPRKKTPSSRSSSIYRSFRSPSIQRPHKITWRAGSVASSGERTPVYRSHSNLGKFIRGNTPQYRSSTRPSSSPELVFNRFRLPSHPVYTGNKEFYIPPTQSSYEKSPSPAKERSRSRSNSTGAEVLVFNL